MGYRRIGAALVLLLALTRPLPAQTIDYGSITAQDAGSCATAKACLTFTLPANTNALVLQASGTFTGLTGTIEGTSDGTTWATLTATRLSDGAAVTTISAAGQFAVNNPGLVAVRVRAGAFSSGTATIYAVRGYQVAKTAVLPDSEIAQKGTGTATGPVSATLTVNTTQTGTGANTNETDLWTYSLPANTLSVNGKALRITAWGTTAANGNNKLIQLYFGAGESVGSSEGSSAANGSAWRLEMVVTRTGASVQQSIGWGILNGIGTRSLFVTQAQDTTGAITIKVTGTNGTASANDVVFRGAIVEALN